MSPRTQLVSESSLTRLFSDSQCVGPIGVLLGSVRSMGVLAGFFYIYDVVRHHISNLIDCTRARVCHHRMLIILL